MKHFYHLFIALLFTSFSLGAKEEFQPYMIAHKTKGCPENSYCQPEQAKDQMKWKDNMMAMSKNKIQDLNLLKESMGAPVDFYLATNSPNEEKTILWDSRCENHRKANPKIYLARTFLKQLPIDTPTANAHIPFLLIQKGKELLRFAYSKGDFPLYYENDAIFLNREEEGVYYAVKIFSSGKYQFLEPITTKLVPEEVACPDDLVAKFRELITNKAVYTSAVCRQIWDRKKEVFYTTITGDTCF